MGGEKIFEGGVTSDAAFFYAQQETSEAFRDRHFAAGK